MLDDTIVATDELGDNNYCIGPSYMKSLIDKTYETAMLLALLDDIDSLRNISTFNSARLLLLG